MSPAIIRRDISTRLISFSPILKEAVPGAIGGKSAAVITAFTPGSASALLLSMRLIRACANGLCTIFAYSIPGTTTSAPKSDFPVTFSTPSTFGSR